MTNKELQEKLSRLPDDLNVYVYDRYAPDEVTDVRVLTEAEAHPPVFPPGIWL